jgi:mono/diheme cytochrome c family protein
MKQFVLGAAVAAVAAVIAGGGVMLSGMVNVAADEPHSDIVFNFLAQARESAVARAAADITVPADLGDSERVRRGAGNYAAMCAGCHLSPSENDSEIRSGLYPVPPDLTRERESHDTGGAHAAALLPNAATDFWVIKHGIKASGMAAWGRGGMTDENIWDLVAFIDTLPRMGVAEYRAWVASSDGHAHGAVGMDSHGETGTSPSHEPAHTHDHGHDGDHTRTADETTRPSIATGAHTHADGAIHPH